MKKMETTFKWSDPEKLLFVWYLLYISKKPHKLKSKYGARFFDINLYQFEYYHLLKRSHLLTLLDHFLQNGLIEEVYLEKILHDEQGDTTYVDETFHASARALKLKNGFLGPLFSSYRELDDAFLLNFSLRFDPKQLEDFIRYYLECWSTNDLQLPSKQFLSSERQLEELVTHIHQLSKNYNRNHMLLERIMPEEGDFTASVLFLEGIGAFEIEDFLFHKYAFQISLKDQFFRVFEASKPITNALLQRLLHTVNTRFIIYELPFTFICGSQSYKINRNSLPFHMITLQLEEGFVDEAKLAELLKDKHGLNLNKGFEDFRRRLRKQFQFSNTETFFERRQGRIYFSALFDFHSYKQKT